MSTISSMARNNYLMLKYAQNNGASLFGSSTSTAKASSLGNGSNSMRSSYASLQSPAFSTMSGLLGIRSSMNDMAKSYDAAAKTFHTEFASTMDDLSKASNAIKGMNFDVGGTSAVAETVNEDGTLTRTKSPELTDVLKGIENFASNYNDAIDFFQDNADVSKRMKLVRDEFADTAYRSGLLSTIGIAVGSDGKMKIDEDVLTSALMETPERVGRLLGKDGLAGKADQHVSFARSQQNHLFPPISTALGSAMKSSSIYSGKSLLRLSSYSSIGNFLNMWG